MKPLSIDCSVCTTSNRHRRFSTSKSWRSSVFPNSLLLRLEDLFPKTIFFFFLHGVFVYLQSILMWFFIFVFFLFPYLGYKILRIFRPYHTHATSPSSFICSPFVSGLVSTRPLRTFPQIWNSHYSSSYQSSIPWVHLYCDFINEISF